jgi:murein L,D-transpeptidase YcbB/YkuD
MAAVILVGGCRKARKTISAPNSPDYASNLQALTGQGQLPMLRWPNYSDFQADVKTFYGDRNYELAWSRDGRPTAAATGFIEAFRGAEAKGLRPADYDAGTGDADRWQERVAKLGTKNADAIAQFDVAMTVDVMRLISDLRIGRVNPSHFNFAIDTQEKKYNLPEFVSDQAVDSKDVAKLITEVEPDSDDYRSTEQALDQYLKLAQQQKAAGDAVELPSPGTTLNVGQHYPAVAALRARLALEGDLPAGGGGADTSTSFDQAFSDGVKSYQERHGLTADGKLSAATVKSLNVPMSDRVLQLESSLERWRWLPEPYLHARLMVNLPEFVLRGYTPEHTRDFTMKVVVGKVVGEHRTPVFTHMMKYLIFRPYWNVPVDIAKKELVPHMEAKPGYLEAKNYEVINNKGEVQASYTTARVEHGGLLVRERPGPTNSLGLVKFMFPNQYDIYLHSTPQTSLFSRSRRDFSHGCVRVQKPEDLAVWVLNGQTDKDSQPWDMEKVNDAMQNGQDNKQVNLKTPLPIVIFYLTAHVGDDGKVDFFDDIYGYDADMQKVLEQGPPYPVEPEPVQTTKPGDTA